MTENMKKFLEKVSADKELAEKAGKLTREELIVFAAQQGLALGEADFAAPADAVSDDELETVAGGGECVCAVAGGGTAAHCYPACGCVMVGIGEDFGGNPDRCACGIGGYGKA